MLMSEKWTKGSKEKHSKGWWINMQNTFPMICSKSTPKL